MYVCLCVCLSFMHYYAIHPIAMKLWEVVEYTPAKVSGKKNYIFIFFNFYLFSRPLKGLQKLHTGLLRNTYNVVRYFCNSPETE